MSDWDYQINEGDSFKCVVLSISSADIFKIPKDKVIYWNDKLKFISSHVWDVSGFNFHIEFSLRKDRKRLPFFKWWLFGSNRDSTSELFDDFDYLSISINSSDIVR